MTFLGRPCVVKERFVKQYRHALLDTELSLTRTTREARLLAKCRKLAIRAPTVYFVDQRARKLYLERIDGITLKEYICRNATQPARLIGACRAFGALVATLHSNDVTHGDLTSSNVLIEHSVIERFHRELDAFAAVTPAATYNNMLLDAPSSSTSTSSTTSSTSTSSTSSVPMPNTAPRPTLVLIDLGLGDVTTLDEDKAVDLYVLCRALTSAHPAHDPMLFDAVVAEYGARSTNATRVLTQFETVRLRGRKKVLLFVCKVVNLLCFNTFLRYKLLFFA